MTVVPASTLFVTNPVCLEHRTNPGHPESPARLESVLAALRAAGLAGLACRDSRRATAGDLALAHDPAHIDDVLGMMPETGFNFIDDDTIVSPASGIAALYAAGAVLDAVDAVMAKKAMNAFCAVRPPGHHAHRAKSGGFCLFNNIAVGAKAALERHGLSRVAIVDFDVHHGDGTQDIFWDDGRVFFASMHQSPLYPFTGDAQERGGAGNILNIPLAAGSDGVSALSKMKAEILPALIAFAPEMIFVSAGFDAHEKDPIGGLHWRTQDFAAMTAVLKQTAASFCEGRLVMVLEGGYDTVALGESVAVCVQELMEKA